jgi:hypothetical protein
MHTYIIQMLHQSHECTLANTHFLQKCQHTTNSCTHQCLQKRTLCSASFRYKHNFNAIILQLHSDTSTISKQLFHSFTPIQAQFQSNYPSSEHSMIKKTNHSEWHHPQTERLCMRGHNSTVHINMAKPIRRRNFCWYSSTRIASTKNLHTVEKVATVCWQLNNLKIINPKDNMSSFPPYTCKKTRKEERKKNWKKALSQLCTY